MLVGFNIRGNGLFLIFLSICFSIIGMLSINPEGPPIYPIAPISPFTTRKSPYTVSLRLYGLPAYPYKVHLTYFFFLP